MSTIRVRGGARRPSPLTPLHEQDHGSRTATPAAAGRARWRQTRHTGAVIPRSWQRPCQGVSYNARVTVYDGSAKFLMPDGQQLVVTVHAGLRGGRWAGSLVLPNTERRLEQGDVCQLAGGPLGELRVVITAQFGHRHYAFIGLITPAPWERLEPPV